MTLHVVAISDLNPDKTSLNLVLGKPLYRSQRQDSGAELPGTLTHRTSPAGAAALSPAVDNGRRHQSITALSPAVDNGRGHQSITALSPAVDKGRGHQSITALESPGVLLPKQLGNWTAFLPGRSSSKRRGKRHEWTPHFRVPRQESTLGTAAPKEGVSLEPKGAQRL